MNRPSGSRNRGHNPLDRPVYRTTGFAPVPHQHDVVLGVDPDDVSAIADGGEARSRPARPLLLLRVQPPQIAVVRAVRRGRRCLLDPLLRDQSLALPITLVED